MAPCTGKPNSQPQGSGLARPLGGTVDRTQLQEEGKIEG